MRHKSAERIILQKIIRYCDEITLILKKHHCLRTYFEQDMEFQFACGMCIIQIGELVTRLNEKFLQDHSEIPWRQMRGMRNIYAHDYDVIDCDTVWETITEEIPALRKRLQVILEHMGEEE